jgi:organic radical activating enzyme
MAFNKHIFIDELREEILDNKFETRGEIERYIHEQIDNACIYTSECFEIAQELHKSRDFGDATNIGSLAYECLLELVYEELDLEELIHDEDKKLEDAIDKVTIVILEELEHGEEIELNDTFTLYKYSEDDVIVIVKTLGWEEQIQILYNVEDNKIIFEEL